jgi:hypothetical protein
LGFGSPEEQLGRLWSSFWPLLMVAGTALFIWHVYRKTEGYE